MSEPIKPVSLKYSASDMEYHMNKRNPINLIDRITMVATQTGMKSFEIEVIITDRTLEVIKDE